MRLHGLEIAVIVTTFDAERTDDDVGGFPDRDGQGSQLAIVAGSATGQIGIQKGNDGILSRVLFVPRGMGLVADALAWPACASAALPLWLVWSAGPSRSSRETTRPRRFQYRSALPLVRLNV